jgi:anti-sigma factor RsiW
MCDKELLVAYLYDEADAAGRARMEAHLRECAACRDELAAFRGLRTGLAQWMPPLPDFDVKVVRQQKPSWREWWTPAFGLAAAAVLVLAVASALAHVQVTRDGNGFTVRTGWGATPPATPAATATQVGVTAGQSAQIEAKYAALERRLNGLEAAVQKPSNVSTIAAAAPSRMSDAEILRRVRDLLAENDSKQQQELAVRISQLLRDVNAQRMSDLTRIQQGLGRIDAMTTAEAAQHRELVNYVMTASQKQQK